MDKGYDNGPIHDGCNARDICPVTPLRQTPAVVRGDHKAPTCERGEWVFAGADYKRKATKWRCPTGQVPAEVRTGQGRPPAPAHPPPHRALKALYSSRGATEREYGRLKHEWAMLPLRVRGLDRVALHADPTILAKLASALAKTRAVPVAA